MVQKVRTVPTTTDSATEAIKVRINNGSIEYKLNGVWTKLTREVTPELSHLNIMSYISRLKLDDYKNISNSNPIDSTGVVFGNNVSSIPLFCQRNLANIILNKTKCSSKINKFTEFSDIDIELLDYNQLINRFNLVMKNADQGMLDHGLSNISKIVISDKCKLLRISILYQLKSDIKLNNTTRYRRRDLLVDPKNNFTNIDNYFSIEIRNNLLRVLKSWEVDQVFIRQINFIK